jgi:prepilin peptidase CpaA
MEYLTELKSSLLEHWPVWFITVALIVAAVIDGKQLRVPNWLTFPLILSGWTFSLVAFGWAGLGWSVLGTFIGLALLLPPYAIGGMGAGDVKLLAGVGAWMYAMLESAHVAAVTPAGAMFYSFCVSAIIGAVLSVLMIFWRRAVGRHFSQFWMILAEILTVRSPAQLSEIAADRKSSMLLLPYGIPIAIGTIAYFAWMGMLV